MRSRKSRLCTLLAAVVSVAALYVVLRPARARRQIRAVVRALAPSQAAFPAVVFDSQPQMSLTRKVARAPNVLLVLIDTLRADHLGAYGYPRPTSPFMDSIAAEGVVFERAISQAPWTLPAVLALMMGKYPSDLGLPSPSAAPAILPLEGETLAERFRSAGYRTLALSDHPAITASGFGRGFERFDSLPQGPFGKWGWSETEAVVIGARWDQLIARTDERPTFAYVHLYYPHAPYEPPEPFDIMFGTGALFTRERFRGGVVNLYDGEIRRTDELLGRIVPHFQQLGDGADATVTALMSDHGEAFWEHGVLGHEETLHNELLHIPLIVHAPGRVPRGLRALGLAQTVDIGMTLLDVAGLSVPKNASLRGRSLLPDILNRGPSADARFAISESPVQGAQTRSIQTATVKVIRSGSEAVAYLLSIDPAESRPLALATVPGSVPLNVILESTRPPEHFRGRMDAAGRERLKALGYVLGGAEPSKPWEWRE